MSDLMSFIEAAIYEYATEKVRAMEGEFTDDEFENLVDIECGRAHDELLAPQKQSFEEWLDDLATTKLREAHQDEYERLREALKGEIKLL